jgi:hypothetical protein
MKRTTGYMIEFFVVITFIVGIGIYTVPKFLQAQTINTPHYFPDHVFRRHVEMYMGVQHDETFSRMDVEKASDIFTSRAGQNSVIRSIKGLEYLTQVEFLSLKNHLINDLDLSKNIRLRLLECTGSNIKILDLSELFELNELYCPNNKLTKIVLPNQTKLRIIDVCENQLTELDLRNSPELNILRLSGNSLKTLNVSNNQDLVEIFASDNMITSVTLHDMPRLETVHLEYNPLQSFQVSNVPRLRSLRVPFSVFTNPNLLDDIPSLEELVVVFAHNDDTEHPIAQKLRQEFRTSSKRKIGNVSSDVVMMFETRIRSIQ